MATRIGLCLLALFVTAGLCRGGDQVPYKDRVEAVITGFSVTEGGLFALPFRVVRGQGTHVGRFTSEGMLLVEPTSLEFVGTNTITAANGDEIDIEILGADADDGGGRVHHHCGDHLRRRDRPVRERHRRVQRRGHAADGTWLRRLHLHGGRRRHHLASEQEVASVRHREGAGFRGEPVPSPSL